MKFTQHYSSSSGNLYVVTASNGKRLLIDPGVTWSKVMTALNYDLSGIVGCLVSHEHKDHSKAVREAMKAGINVYGSPGTLDALYIIHTRRAIGMLRNTYYPMGPFQVAAYNSNHDAAEPLLFTVRCDGEQLLFATDTSHITQQFQTPFNIIALSCSYDKDTLQKRVESGDINKEVAKRLLTSHMEKQVAMDYISRFCDLSRCREIHLLHLSGDNIDKTRIKKEFQEHFFIATRMVESANRTN